MTATFGLKTRLLGVIFPTNRQTQVRCPIRTWSASCMPVIMHGYRPLQKHKTQPVSTVDTVL